MGEVNWTSEAEGWLREVHDYIAQDSPEAATKVVNGIFERARVLVSYPEVGHRYRVEPTGDIRILLYGHYRITYLLKKDGVIDIIGVFHGALDIDRYLP